MKLVDVTSWASSFKAKEELLISRLVYATTHNSTEVRFPFGSAVFLGGWDRVQNVPKSQNKYPQLTF